MIKLVDKDFKALEHEENKTSKKGSNRTFRDENNSWDEKKKTYEIKGQLAIAEKWLANLKTQGKKTKHNPKWKQEK